MTCASDELMGYLTAFHGGVGLAFPEAVWCLIGAPIEAFLLHAAGVCLKPLAGREQRSDVVLHPPHARVTAKS